MRRFSFLAVAVLLISALYAPHAARAVPEEITGNCEKINDTITTDYYFYDGYFKAGEDIRITLTSGSNPQDTEIEFYPLDNTNDETELFFSSVGQMLTLTIPSDGYYEFEIEPNESESFPDTFSSFTVSCGAAFQTFAVTVWGANNVTGVVWQFLGADGKWWWLVQPGTTTKLVTPIEHRDRKNDQGKVIPNYPLSRLTVVVGTAPYDPTKYKAYDAATLKQLHQVWLEIGPENSPDRKSVWVP